MICTNSEVQRNRRTYVDVLDTDEDIEQDQFEELGLDAVMQPKDGVLRPPRKSIARASRRELVWKSQKHEKLSLEDIALRYRGFLPTSFTNSTLNHRRGRYTTKTAHRCPGYNRIEITLNNQRYHTQCYCFPFYSHSS
ncbi:hypothetical protein M413DRAFT_156461 [Hebeloma cylindrosporum]|uniref:Uncharacterized protein n=1 Tax=Hebeloma cylindrosporum TaxID=76867 RepID=A0A0C2YIM8_HEBCY|nr:hypothetical protein M413DRAFT_156461 [Hebeloma cylindrosporum h7]